MSGQVASRSVPRPRGSRAVAARRISLEVQRGVDVALQPIVELRSGAVVGVEALARFPDGRSPDTWFAEADSLGLGVALELAAIRGALSRLSELPSDVSMSVNVSAATACTPALSQMLASAPGGRVVLEITEHVPVADYPALATALSTLRARGV
ncbi:MAG: EAL domain-containing protein, partial [Chloroflexi bacterium]|nr:EAL domain-containing protein [Chloroflexota bacterium]